MLALLCLVLAVLTSPLKSKSRLEAKNAALRHQLIILRRKVRGRVRPTNNDRRFLVQLYRWFPSILQVVTIIQPETIVRWHRASFRFYWRWKSRPRRGRPQIEADLRTLIRRMSIENPLWGTPRIRPISSKQPLKSAYPEEWGWPASVTYPPNGHGSTKCWASTLNNRHFRTSLCSRQSLLPGNGILGPEIKAPKLPLSSETHLSRDEAPS